MSDPIVSTTRQVWHAVAELVLAGPQYRRSGTIRLQIRPGGFGTVKDPDLAVDGAFLVAGDRRLPIAATTLRALAAAAGLDVGAPEGLYHDGSKAQPDDEVTVDGRAAQYLARCFAAGDEALRRLAPSQTPVLWPEHFDVASTIDEVNYGVSAGDGFLDEPYAYVGPWQLRTGEFWNAPFGAVRPMSALPNVDAVEAFFTDGHRRAQRDPTVTDTGQTP